MRAADEVLTEFDVPHECRIISAHRTPDLMAEFATAAEGRGIEVVIAGAGGAAHLPGMTAAHTTLPVLGVPVESKALKGLDSLLSIVQMPGGVPVATLAIGTAGAKNAALLAVSILANKRPPAAPETEGLSGTAEARGSRRQPDVKSVLPGSTIGVLGSGQLGRMFAISARRLGYRVHTYSPDRDSPTGQIADEEIDAPYEDLDRVREFASAVDVVTFEFENVPAATADAAAECALVRPAGDVLHITQHRLREKTFLRRTAFPSRASSASPDDDPRRVFAEFGPAILKTAGFGYDGKGQYRVKSLAEAEAAWDAMGRQEAVLEAVVDFEAELSVIGVRGEDGDCVFYAPSANAHVNGILDVSSAPAPFDAAIAPKSGRDHARSAASAQCSGCLMRGVLPDPQR